MQHAHFGGVDFVEILQVFGQIGDQARCISRVFRLLRTGIASFTPPGIRDRLAMCWIWELGRASALEETLQFFPVSRCQSRHEGGAELIFQFEGEML